LQTIVLFRARNRVKSNYLREKSVRKMEFQLRFAIGALAALAFALLLGLTAVLFREWIPGEILNRLVLIYGATIFLGFFSLLTQSFLYKIIPHLVWIKKFTLSAGRVKAPKIEALVPRKSAIAQLAVYSFGTVLAIVAFGFELEFLVFAAALLLFASSVWLSINFAIVWKRAVPIGEIVSARSCETPMEVLKQAR